MSMFSSFGGIPNITGGAAYGAPVDNHSIIVNGPAGNTASALGQLLQISNGASTNGGYSSSWFGPDEVAGPFRQSNTGMLVMVALVGLVAYLALK